VTPYVGGPITPDTAAAAAWMGGHAFVSFLRPDQLELVIRICQSYAIDNGAFSAWKSGEPITDWSKFYEFAADNMRVPSCDFAVIPDVIDGDERANDALVDEWPLPRHFGAPVWHMHESYERLVRLAAEFPRICIGSSAQFSQVGSPAWWGRMRMAMLMICDERGRPTVRVHGLRMLNPKVFSKLPLASADSTNIAINIGYDKRWTGSYPPPTKAARAVVLRARTEAENSPPTLT